MTRKHKIIVMLLALMPLLTIVAIAETDFSVVRQRMSLAGEVIEDDNTFNITTEMSVANMSCSESMSYELNSNANAFQCTNNIAVGDLIYVIHLYEREPNGAPAGARWYLTLTHNNNPVDWIYINNNTAENTNEYATVWIKIDQPSTTYPNVYVVKLVRTLT